MVAQRTPSRLLGNPEFLSRLAGAFLQHRDLDARILRCSCLALFSPCQLRRGAECGHAADGSRSERLYAPCGCDYTQHGAEPVTRLTQAEARTLRDVQTARLQEWARTCGVIEFTSFVDRALEPAPWPRPELYLPAAFRLQPLPVQEEAYRVLCAAFGSDPVYRWVRTTLAARRTCEHCDTILTAGEAQVSLRATQRILCAAGRHEAGMGGFPTLAEIQQLQAAAPAQVPVLGGVA